MRIKCAVLLNKKSIIWFVDDVDYDEEMFGISTNMTGVCALVRVYLCLCVCVFECFIDDDYYY